MLSAALVAPALLEGFGVGLTSAARFTLSVNTLHSVQRIRQQLDEQGCLGDMPLRFKKAKSFRFLGCRLLLLQSSNDKIQNNETYLDTRSCA